MAVRTVDFHRHRDGAVFRHTQVGGVAHATVYPFFGLLLIPQFRDLSAQLMF